MDEDLLEIPDVESSPSKRGRGRPKKLPVPTSAAQTASKIPTSSNVEPVEQKQPVDSAPKIEISPVPVARQDVPVAKKPEVAKKPAAEKVNSTPLRRRG